MSKYYYFEVSYPKLETKDIFKNKNIKLEHFKNSNQLVFKPWTSSTGDCGNLFFTQKEDENNVFQYWIDMDKYVEGYDHIIDYWIEHVLPTLEHFKEIKY